MEVKALEVEPHGTLPLLFLYHCRSSGEVLWDLQPFFSRCHPPRVAKRLRFINGLLAGFHFGLLSLCFSIHGEVILARAREE